MRLSRILLHDFGAYPFMYQLGRELARRGHTLDYLYCGSNPTTPLGLEQCHDAIDGTFRSRPIFLPKPIAKGSFIQRHALERRYGHELARVVAAERPDLLVVANTPIDSLGEALRAARNIGAASVIWVQDLLGEAALRILPGKVGPFGTLIGHLYRHREDILLRRADYLVAITEDFAPAFQRARIPDERWTVIPNWGPLDTIQPMSRVNPWSVEKGLHTKVVLLYSGNLGFKHNAGLLIALARSLKDRKDTAIVVNAEGPAAEWLRAEIGRQRLTETLMINGFQPFARMSEVLGSADILLAILEPDAAVYSVPSKVLSNLCAGRPQVLALPDTNLAARIVRESQSGLVCNPRDEKSFVQAAWELLEQPALRQSMGVNARAYAASHFRIDVIVKKFEESFDRALHAMRAS